MEVVKYEGNRHYKNKFIMHEDNRHHKSEIIVYSLSSNYVAFNMYFPYFAMISKYYTRRLQSRFLTDATGIQQQR